MENEFSNRISVKNIVLAGMFAAFLAVMSQVSLPMPTGVPITVQVFAVALVGVILGWKRGVLAVLVYILIGAVGVPVFANFKGGLSVLTGLTGGYIIAWPVMTILCRYPAEDAECKAEYDSEYYFISGGSGCL